MFEETPNFISNQSKPSGSSYTSHTGPLNLLHCCLISPANHDSSSNANLASSASLLQDTSCFDSIACPEAPTALPGDSLNSLHSRFLAPENFIERKGNVDLPKSPIFFPCSPGKASKVESALDAVGLGTLEEEEIVCLMAGPSSPSISLSSRSLATSVPKSNIIGPDEVLSVDQEFDTTALSHFPELPTRAKRKKSNFHGKIL
ncbi:unnamed protein product [Protopolystoma xenopodis]|uniref:Uncharacterized protein n=1 Tax=Protopolystoma xenopodis TaxID=117903 RepID=A0A448WW87_9PLAT|nr:unnamed protein product [Protopolystoma xenopodis]